MMYCYSAQRLFAPVGDALYLYLRKKTRDVSRLVAKSTSLISAAWHLIHGGRSYSKCKGFNIYRSKVVNCKGFISN